MSFEQGPIRPPSEARSLLIRVTRNCPWNKCAFCRTYRDEKFELRSLPEVIEDIKCMASIADKIRELSLKKGEGGSVTRKVVQEIFNHEHIYDDQHRSIAFWLYSGGESVFIQDADSLVLKTVDFTSILSYIRACFPFVNRITTYCRGKTAARKSIEDLKEIKEAGLSRIHIGLESGYDPLLQFIRKGVTAAEHIEGGQKVKAAGISLSEYIIPGLGGERWSQEHAGETARVINEINPDFIRLRSLYVKSGTSLMEMMERGEFSLLADDAVVQEIRVFLSKLEGIESTIVSDHILNLLEEVEGKLPHDRDKLIAVVDRYLSLSATDRLVFRLGRRRGIYRRLDDMHDENTYAGLASIVRQYEDNEKGSLDKYLSMIMHNYV